MPSVSIELNGATVADFEDSVSRYPEQVRQEVPAGMKEGFTVIQVEAQANHKYTSRSGNLDRSIDMQVDAPSLTGSIFLAEPGQPRGTIYGKFQHMGTGLYGPEGRAFTIVPVNKSVLRWVGPGGRFVFAKSVTIKGIHPDPFLYRAAEVKTPEFVAAIERSMDVAKEKAGL